MLPSIARVTLIWRDASLTVTRAVRPARSASTISASSRRRSLSLECLLGGGTLVDRCGEGLVHLVAQQRPQCRLVALGKGADDHLESGTRPFEKLRRIEARIGAANPVQPFGHRIASAGLPAGARLATSLSGSPGVATFSGTGLSAIGAYAARTIRAAARCLCAGRERCAAAAPGRRRSSRTG